MTQPTWVTDQLEMATAEALELVAQTGDRMTGSRVEIAADAEQTAALLERVAGFPHCIHLRRAPGPAIVRLNQARADCRRCVRTHYTRPPGVCGMCGGPGDSQVIVLHLGSYVVLGDVCPACLSTITPPQENTYGR